MIKTYTDNIDYLPFEDPKNENEVIWRYSKNPIIKRNPIEGLVEYLIVL